MSGAPRAGRFADREWIGRPVAETVVWWMIAIALGYLVLLALPSIVLAHDTEQTADAAAGAAIAGAAAAAGAARRRGRPPKPKGPKIFDVAPPRRRGSGQRKASPPAPAPDAGTPPPSSPTPPPRPFGPRGPLPAPDDKLPEFNPDAKADRRNQQEKDNRHGLIGK